MVQRIQTTPVRGFGSFTSNPKSRGLDTFSGAPQISKTNTLLELSKSLGVVSENNYKKAYDDEVKNQEIIKTKKSVYAERIKKDLENKTIDAVRIGELYPEMSESTAMYMSEYMGSRNTLNELKDWKESLPASVTENKELLAVEVAKKRKEILDKNQGNDFYLSGSLKTFDDTLQGWNKSWANQRAIIDKGKAADYLDLQTELFIQKNIGSLTPEKFKEYFDGVIEKKDKRLTPLGNKEFNDTIVSSILRQADKFNDLELIDAIPERYKNKDNKKTIESYRESISTEIRTDSEYQVTLKKRVEDEKIIAGKSEVLDAMLSKDPKDLIKIMEKYKGLNDRVSVAIKKFITTARETETYVSDGDSLNNSTDIQNQIKESAFLNDFTSFDFAEGYIPTEKELREKISSMTNIKSKEVNTIIKNLKTLMGGYGIKNNPEVKSAIDRQLKSISDNMKTNSTFMKILQSQGLGLNFSQNVRETMEESLKLDTAKWLEENKGKRPSASYIKEMITNMRKAATDYQNSVVTFSKNPDVQQQTRPEQFQGYVEGGKTKPLRTNETFSQENINDGKPSKYVGTKPEDVFNPSKYVLLEGDELTKFNEVQAKAKSKKVEAEAKAKEKVSETPLNQKPDPNYEVITDSKGIPQKVNMSGITDEEYDRQLTRFSNDEITEEQWTNFETNFNNKVQQNLARQAWEDKDNKAKQDKDDKDKEVAKQTLINSIKAKLNKVTTESSRKALERKLSELQS